MTSSVRLDLGWVYSYLISDSFLAVGWAALTIASPTAVTKRFSSLPRFLNERSSATGQATTNQQPSSSATAASTDPPIHCFGVTVMTPSISTYLAFIAHPFTLTL